MIVRSQKVNVHRNIYNEKEVLSYSFLVGMGVSNWDHWETGGNKQTHTYLLSIITLMLLGILGVKLEVQL